MSYSSPTGSNLNPQNQFISPPAYQQKTCVRFNPQQSPRLAGAVPQYSKNIQTQPLVSFKIFKTLYIVLKKTTKVYKNIWF